MRCPFGNNKLYNNTHETDVTMVTTLFQLGMLIERSRAPIVNLQHEGSDPGCETLAALVQERVEEAERTLEQRLPQRSASAPAAVIAMSFHVRSFSVFRLFLVVCCVCV